ncbi:MAG TPA: hypothetical protein VMH87_19610 [Pseudomonadales bacterium]|nr:hypothetical protein [Pseudomonadales bacterium]
MNEAGTSLSNRVLALEARVQVLEKMAANLPEKSRQVKSWARDVSDSHLKFHMDMLSLIEDHVEVLKLIHSTVGPIDRKKNKLVHGYIRRAEFKLGQFQERFAQLEEMQKRFENGAPQNSPPPPVEPREISLPKPSALNRLLRTASWWNM